jgi:hypothetical protein
VDVNALAARSAARSLAGLVGAGLALAALVIFVPGREDKAPAAPWAPSGATMVETVALDGDRTLRLWVSPIGYWVQSLRGGEHEAAVGASGSRDQYTAEVLLDGLVGKVPAAGARTVEVRPEAGGEALRATVHDGVFLAPGWIVTPGARAVLVTPYDAAGRPLGDEVTVPVGGR